MGTLWKTNQRSQVKPRLLLNYALWLSLGVPSSCCSQRPLRRTLRSGKRIPRQDTALRTMKTVTLTTERQIAAAASTASKESAKNAQRAPSCPRTRKAWTSPGAKKFPKATKAHQVPVNRAVLWLLLLPNRRYTQTCTPMPTQEEPQHAPVTSIRTKSDRWSAKSAPTANTERRNTATAQPSTRFVEAQP